MVMNPRDIRGCISAIQALQIDKVFFRAFTEKQLEKEISEFVDSSSYKDYLILSDDTVPSQAALDAVLYHLSTHGVVTGWSNNHPTGNGANLMLHPLTGVRWELTQILFKTRWADENVLGIGFEKIEKIRKMPPLFRTYFVGFSLTGMRRELWLRFPFTTIYSNVTKRYQSSDLSLSKRLQEAGVTAWCARDAFVPHLKSHEGWLVGKVKPQAILGQDLDYIRR